MAQKSDHIASGQPARSEKTRAQEQLQERAHPRAHIPDWKWKGAVFVMVLTTVINGYDVSNVANIQPQLYEAFGNIDVLPWIALSFSLAVFASQSLARKIIYCFDMKLVYLISLLVFMIGATVAGSAPNISAVIVGRIVMGLGGAVAYQCNLSYLAVLATPAETPGLFGIMSATWAVGLVIGGPIGSALAENHNTTWRWAFYMNLPWAGLSVVLGAICMPRHSLVPNSSLRERLMNIDPLGIAFNMASPAVFAIALTFSGPIWDWGSGSSVAAWVIFAVVLLSWGIQQWFCVFTTPTERAFPVHMLSRLDLIPIWLASGCAGASYAIMMYYMPLFFAFVRGHDALQQTVRILPFILVLIIGVMFVGALLPVIGRYNVIYIAAGILTLSASVAMVSSLDADVSDSQVMGLEALIGAGLGFSFQHGVGISNIINKNHRDRVDSVVIFNMCQMGAIAVVLAIAGCIFQNVGFELVNDALRGHSYSKEEIRQALAGVSSSVWQLGDEEAMESGLQAVATVMAREFYIVVAAGVVCLCCGLVMKWEKLDYAQKQGVESEVVDTTEDHRA